MSRSPQIVVLARVVQGSRASLSCFTLLLVCGNFFRVCKGGSRSGMKQKGFLPLTNMEHQKAQPFSAAIVFTRFSLPCYASLGSDNWR